MIKVKNLSKRYDENIVLDNLNFQVDTGCIYGIVGTNGVGKTTFLRILAGLSKPDHGEIYIDNIKRVGNNSNKKISFVPDSASLYEYLSGEEYLLFFASILDVPKELRKDKVSYLIDLFNLTSAKDELIKTYSHGMKQKVSIASALLNDPDILLLDEPLTGIDLINSHIIRQYIKKFVKADKTVILTTHLLELAHSLCDKIGILHKGKIVEEFSTNKLSLDSIEKRITSVYLGKNSGEMMSK